MTKIIQVKMNAENKCEICEKVYITKQKLKKHTTYSHNNIGKCEICDNHFGNSQLKQCEFCHNCNMNIHIKWTLETFPFSIH